MFPSWNLWWCTLFSDIVWDHVFSTTLIGSLWDLRDSLPWQLHCLQGLATWPSVLYDKCTQEVFRLSWRKKTAKERKRRNYCAHVNQAFNSKLKIKSKKECFLTTKLLRIPEWSEYNRTPLSWEIAQSQIPVPLKALQFLLFRWTKWHNEE